MNVKSKFKIKDMHCTSCAMNIDFDLEDVDGVKTSNTNYAKSECVVEFDANKVDNEKIISTIKKAGYVAEPINIQ